MPKILDGTELVGYIKERQAKQVRALRQASRVFPRLVVIKSASATSVINTYVRMKQRYAEDILIETVVEAMDDSEMIDALKRHNADPNVHGIIIQLPITDTSKTDEIVNQIAPEKDVDGLGKDAAFESATAGAVNWLLAGYAITLADKKITLVGNGRLVGAPLAKMWRESGHDVTVLDSSSKDIGSVLRESDIIISATGVPHLVTSDMVTIGATVVDAGTASENGVIVGDIDPGLRERNDLTITPEKGGVGPLTIAALFDNVIQSAQRVAGLAKN